MAYQYSDLENRAGTIWNKKLNKGYPNPTALAADLGITADKINWASISPAATQPATTTPITGGTPMQQFVQQQVATGATPGVPAPQPDMSQATPMQKWVQQQVSPVEMMPPDAFQQIKDIYQTNFGRQPTQIELNDQVKAINEGRLTIDSLTQWAKNSPQNISKTGQVSPPQAFQGAPLSTTDTTEPTGTPKVDKQVIIDWLKKQPEFLKLPKNMQDDMIAYIDILGIQDIESQERLLKALDLAKEQADPYFAEIIRLTKDEITQGVGVTTADFIARQRDIQQQRTQLEADLGRELTSEEADYLAQKRNLEVKRAQLQKELGREVSAEEADYISQERNIKEKIGQIQEDLTTGKGRLTMDEQAELTRQGRKYEVNLENLRENAAQVGLTFSSRRAIAESRLATEQTDIMESTKRQFGRQLEDLQTRAARGETEAQNLLKDYERKTGERVTALKTGETYQQQQVTNMLMDYQRLYNEKIVELKARAAKGETEAINQLADYTRLYGAKIAEIGRAGEKQLGTAELPALEGYKPLGGVTGKIEEEKLNDIMARAEALAGLSGSFLK